MSTSSSRSQQPAGSSRSQQPAGSSCWQQPAGSSVTTAFGKAAAAGRAALVGYLPAGFPDKETGIRAALAMAEAGADVIEVGLPYSDPLMDGPVIADAVYRALSNGTKIADVLDTVRAIADSGTAALVMTYWNPVDRYGVDAFARDLANAGGAGLITPDLTPEEAGPWLEASDKYHLDRVFLVAPSSTTQRITEISGLCRGFVYAASLMGITGTRNTRGSRRPAAPSTGRSATKRPWTASRRSAGPRGSSRPWNPRTRWRAPCRSGVTSARMA